MISPPGFLVDADADEIHRAVGFEDSGDQDPWDKGADTQDRSIVRAIGNRCHQFMERGRKPLRDRRQLDEQEVRRRGLAVRAAFTAELCVEKFEKSLVDLDRSSLPRRWRCGRVCRRAHAREGPAGPGARPSRCQR